MTETQTQETRPPSTALVEQTLEISEGSLSVDEIACQTNVAVPTIWQGLNRLRDGGDVVPTATYPTRWRLETGE
jgi:predicted Rossmann fold nucleotide-binding protein DprA/Smf involved in DNA uptake